MEVSILRDINFETLVVHPGRGADENTGAVSFPIYQTATFRHPGLYQTTGYDYSRLQNPTREELEISVARLENGSHSFAFSTGMAAISAIIKLFKTGSSIIVSDDLYGGTYRIFNEIYSEYGLEFTYVDTSNLCQIEQAIKPNTKGIFIETPTNPMMKVADISEIVKLANAKGLLTIVDNTFLTPYFQRPLDFGADFVLHSGTKFLSGHNDTLAGFIVTRNDEYFERIQLIQKSEGAVLAPFDSWLVLRGMKTLAVRLEKQQQNAFCLAAFLKTHKLVEKVNYVGLCEHEGYEISKKQSSGFGSMISFAVKDKSVVERVLEKVKIIIFAESLGGVESLITYPAEQTHAAIPQEIRCRLGVNDKLLRLSCGIENADDLIADLEQALD
jgi:cystathionine gamma-synthase